MKKILVTGAFGQIGSELVPSLQQKYGKDQVVAMGNRNIPADFDGVVEALSLPDKEGLKALIEKHDIGTIYHMVSLLSAKGEENPDLTWHINVQSLKDVLDLAREYKIKVFGRARLRLLDQPLRVITLRSLPFLNQPLCMASPK